MTNRADRIAALEREVTSLTTKVGMAQYAMDTVARFVRARIPAGQNPGQAESFFAWIGLIIRIEKERDETKDRLKAQMEYCIDLQRIIEDLCAGRDIRLPETAARYHYDMAVRFLGERRDQ